MRRHLALLCRRLAALLESPSSEAVLFVGRGPSWSIPCDIQTDSNSGLRWEEALSWTLNSQAGLMDTLSSKAQQREATKEEVNQAALESWSYCI